MELPKLVISDIDGVWTDGGMYYDNLGNEWKKFNTSDSAGVLFLKLLKVPLAIITGENTQIVKRRIDKLGVDYLFMGVKDKVVIARNLCDQLSITLDDVAFMGDDINDYQLLKQVGFSASPANAPDYIKKITTITLNKRGGDGAFREFVEYLLTSNNLMDEVIEKYFSINNNETFNQ